MAVTSSQMTYRHAVESCLEEGSKELAEQTVYATFESRSKKMRKDSQGYMMEDADSDPGGLYSFGRNFATVGFRYKVGELVQPPEFYHGESWGQDPGNHGERHAWKAFERRIKKIINTNKNKQVQIMEIVVHSERTPCSSEDYEENDCETFFNRALSESRFSGATKKIIYCQQFDPSQKQIVTERLKTDIRAAEDIAKRVLVSSTSQKEKKVEKEGQSQYKGRESVAGQPGSSSSSSSSSILQQKKSRFFDIIKGLLGNEVSDKNINAFSSQINKSIQDKLSLGLEIEEIVTAAFEETAAKAPLNLKSMLLGKKSELIAQIVKQIALANKTSKETLFNSSMVSSSSSSSSLASLSQPPQFTTSEKQVDKRIASSITTDSGKTDISAAIESAKGQKKEQVGAEPAQPIFTSIPLKTEEGDATFRAKRPKLKSSSATGPSSSMPLSSSPSNQPLLFSTFQDRMVSQQSSFPTAQPLATTPNQEKDMLQTVLANNPMSVLTKKAKWRK